MARKADDTPAPEVPHERAEWHGPEGSELDKVIVEVRGTRTYQAEIYRKDAMTTLARQIQFDDPVMMFRLLQVMADNVLTAAGERTHAETLESLPDPAVDSGVSGLNFNMGTAALLLQRDAIGKKHGFLSREATASHFITTTNAIAERFDLSDGTNLALLATWADAWYWLRFEETGVHGLTYAGMKARASRQTGPAAKAKVKAKRSQLVREEFAKLHPAAQRSLDAATVEILAPLAKRFSKNALVPYTTSTLRKELTALGLVKEARKAWTEAKQKH